MKLIKLNALISLSIITLSLCGCGNNSLIPTMTQAKDDTASEIADGWKDVDGSRYYFIRIRKSRLAGLNLMMSGIT